MGSLAFPNIDQLIAKQEGFGQTGATPTVNHNPGDLIYGPFAVKYGATGQQNGFAVFPDDNSGYQAEDALVQYYSNQGDTVGQLVNAWVPPTAPGNTSVQSQNYANSLAQSLGVTTDTLIPAAEKGNPTNANGLPSLPSLPALGSLGSIGSSIASDLGGLLSKGLIPGVDLSSSWSRIAGLVLGLILIAGGIILFKPVSKIVVNTSRRALAAAA